MGLLRKRLLYVGGELEIYDFILLWNICERLRFNSIHYQVVLAHLFLGSELVLSLKSKSDRIHVFVAKLFS